MADRTPYVGYPESASAQGPRFEPTPEIHVNTPPAAFGANVAEALGHLGEVQQGAGKELFARAVAIKELDSHAKVNKVLADKQDEMTNAFVDYSQLQGDSWWRGNRCRYSNFNIDCRCGIDCQ